MPLYLAPYQGDGLTTATAFRPIGSDQPGSAAIDLRPDPTVVTGRGLLSLPIADANPNLTKIGDDLTEAVTAATRTRIRNALGTGVLTDSRLDDLIFNLLLTPPPGRWPALRPNADGFLEVYLGGLVKRTRVVQGGTTLTESFDTADSDTLGPGQTWVEDQGDVDIVSNKAKAITVPTNARASTALASNDHYVQAKVAVGSNNDFSPGVTARKAASATLTFYLSDMNTSADTVRLFRCVTGSFTSLATGVAFTMVGGTEYLLKLQVNGTTLDVWVDGVAKHSAVTDVVIDGTVVGGKACGIRGDGNAADVGTWNDWEAGDLAAAGRTTKNTRAWPLGVEIGMNWRVEV